MLHSKRRTAASKSNTPATKRFSVTSTSKPLVSGTKSTPHTSKAVKSAPTSVQSNSSSSSFSRSSVSNPASVNTQRPASSTSNTVNNNTVSNNTNNNKPTYNNTNNTIHNHKNFNNNSNRPNKGNLADRIRAQINPNASSLKLSDLNQTNFEVVPPPAKYAAEVPKLISGLRGVLAHDGPVSIGKFDATTPYLDPKAIMPHIPQPSEINWEAIPPFITSSRDPSLLALAASHNARFMGSTSSVSPLLSQLHFAITNNSPINIAQLSHWFANAATGHTRASLKPSISLLRRRGEVIWGVDNPPSGDPKSNQILIDLGKSLERHLTYEWDDFKRIFVRHYDEDGNPANNVYSPEEVQESEAHAFLKNGGFLLRSQLDCEDEGVPSDKKIFDLKTRATLPIRLDVMNHDQYLDYKITARSGLYHSFEREYYDMGRSAFLKYSFQCRIGGMGGIFVAYHNTSELFGFEYIPIEKMDQMVYGSSTKANFVFRHALNLMEEVSSRLTRDLADPTRPLHDTIRLTTDANNGRLVVYAEKFPHVDLDNPEAVDQALSCPHRGSIYIDWLNEDQARSALERRDLPSNGPRSHLISRLESHCLVPSVLYTPPTEQQILKWMQEDSFKVYNLHINLFDEVSNAFVQYPQFDDTTIVDAKVKYSMREISQDGHRPELARRYYQLLLESALMERTAVPADYNLPQEIQEDVYRQYALSIRNSTVDGDGNPIETPDDEILAPDARDPEFALHLLNAKKEYLAEVVDELDISGVKVPVSRADQIRFANKKVLMENLVNQYTRYSDFGTMTEGTGKQLVQEQLKKESFQGNKIILQRLAHQEATAAALAAGLPPPPTPRFDLPRVHRRSF